MSGFAAITGEPDGPPTLPPFGLADGVAALTTAFGIMTALRARETTGRGQVLDMAIIEPLLTLLGPQIIGYDQLGVLQQRTGNRSGNNAPRNTYRCADGRWVAVSTSAQSIAERVMHLVGRSDLAAQPWFASGRQRAEHADELDAAVGEWIGRRSRDEVIDEFEKAQAAVAPIYTAADVLADPQFQALGHFVTTPHAEFGPVELEGPRQFLSATPGAVGPAPTLGQHLMEVLEDVLGYSEERITELLVSGALE
jgi:formyl-CoA transferase